MTCCLSKKRERKEDLIRGSKPKKKKTEQKKMLATSFTAYQGDKGPGPTELRTCEI